MNDREVFAFARLSNSTAMFALNITPCVDCQIGSDHSNSSHSTMTDRPPTFAEVVDHLRSTGEDVVSGDDGSLWRPGERGSLVRIPATETTTPAKEIVIHVLLAGHAAIASYIVAPSDTNPANASLYLCKDQGYRMEDRSKTTRNSIKKALSSLRIEWLTPPDFLRHGHRAFADSRTRHGLSDGTRDAFEKRFLPWLKTPGHRTLGAWRDDCLVAFFTVAAVGDCVEIGGHSRTDGHPWQPNNGLIHCILHHYLSHGRARVVSYGLSSVQEKSNASGLHEFKLRMGFEAIPVHRAFVVNPILRPFANYTSLAIARGVLRLSPGNRWLRKGCGVLKAVVSGNA